MPEPPGGFAARGTGCRLCEAGASDAPEGGCEVGTAGSAKDVAVAVSVAMAVGDGVIVASFGGARSEALLDEKIVGTGDGRTLS